VRVLSYLALAGLCLTAGCARADDCVETIMIDSVEYRLSEQWCGTKLDSAEIAQPGTLVQLPQANTFEDYRIYVTRATRDAFVAMATAAKKDSVQLIADSGFRSPGFQQRIIKRRLEAGETFERIISMVAPPGYSQHHTGRALDLVPSEARFAHTPAYAWLTAHAARFGFHETYPDSPDGLHPWEAWHWVYVPDSAATE
jgi:D-alanyl-D-alanine carboxypeptidase